MTYSTAYNATAGALVVDRAGRVLGAREFGPVKADEQPAKALVEDGRLVVVEPRTGDDVAPDALEAFARTAELNGDGTASTDVAGSDDTAASAPAPTMPKRGRAAASTTEA